MSAQNAYVDASVLIALLFREERALLDLNSYRRLFASKMIQTECLRTCHRMRIHEKYSDKEFSNLLSDLQGLIKDLDIVPVTNEILEEASSAFPTVIGTLDAIHLATGLELRKRNHIDSVFLTHDHQLQVAAQAVGFGVRG